MRRSIIAILAMGLLLSTTLFAAHEAQAALPAQDPGGNERLPVVQTADEILQFWANQDLESAQPVPEAFVSGAANANPPATAFMAQADGLPYIVPGNPPGAAANAPVQQAIPGSAPAVTTLTSPYPFPYDRTSVPWTSLYMAFPWKTNGKLYFTNVDYGPGTHECSATSVTSGPGGNENIVLTAAHCLKNGPGASSQNLLFVPGFRDMTALNGSWAGSGAWVRTTWTGSGNRREDFGFMLTAPNGCGNLADCVGAQGLAWNQSALEQFWAFGYAAAAPFAGQTMYVCTSTTGNLDTTSTGTGAYPVGIGCDLTSGTDGGAWLVWNNFLNAGYANSVFSYKIGAQPYAWYGPYFASNVQSLWDSARFDTP